MKTLTSIIYFMLISSMTFVASAQSNIDKAIAEIENNPKADITCSEKRNPKTKKAYKISKVIRFTGEEEFQKVKIHSSRWENVSSHLQRKQLFYGISFKKRYR